MDVFKITGSPSKKYLETLPIDPELESKISLSLTGILWYTQKEKIKTLNKFLWLHLEKEMMTFL